jgi:aminoglycoside N3'-acetyltransferase
MTCRHHLDKTPVGENSPFRILADVEGKILMVGDINDHCTFMHGMEEIAGVPYVLGNYRTFTLVDENGESRTVKNRAHFFRRPEGNLIQRYDRAPDVLSDGEFALGKVHGADSLLLDAYALREKSVLKMKEDPFYFIDDPSGIYKKG